MKQIDITKTDVEFDALITRMVEMARSGNVLESNHAEAQKIGQELHDLGGIEAMQSAFYIFGSVWQIDPASKVSPVVPMDWVLAWDEVPNWRPIWTI
jgi:hypothetical protein